MCVAVAQHIHLPGTYPLRQHSYVNHALACFGNRAPSPSPKRPATIAPSRGRSPQKNKRGGGAFLCDRSVFRVFVYRGDVYPGLSSFSLKSSAPGRFLRARRVSAQTRYIRVALHTWVFGARRVPDVFPPFLFLLVFPLPLTIIFALVSLSLRSSNNRNSCSGSSIAVGFAPCIFIARRLRPLLPSSTRWSLGDGSISSP